MLTLGLVAFIAGVLCGYISLRAMGWLCVVGICLVSWQAGAFDQGRVHNNGVGVSTAGTRNITQRPGSGPESTFGVNPGDYVDTAWGPSPPGSYDGDTYQVYGQISGGGSWVVIGSYVMHDGGGTTIHDFYWDGSSSNAPPVSYYASGCVTNISPYSSRFIFTASDGHQEVSPPLPPGGFHCFNYTNNSPFTYNLMQIQYDTEGATNNIPFPTQDYPAYTNAVPATGATGSAGLGGQAPNNPMGGQGGANSGIGNTNPVTGNQYANGISNIINMNWAGISYLGSGLGNLANALTNRGSGGTNAEYVRLLSQIVTNTGIDTNDEDLISSNLNYYLSGGGSNDVMGKAWIGSNLIATASLTNAGPVFAVTNIADTSGADDIWIIPVRTNTQSMGYMNLNPMQGPRFASLASWVRTFFTFVLCVFATKYIHMRVQQEMEVLLAIPSRGPGTALAGGGGGNKWSRTFRIAISALGFVAAIEGVTTVIAAAPVWLAAGMSYILGMIGGAYASPLSATGVAVSGSNSGAILAGINLMEMFFPLGFALALFLYLFVFDAMLFSVLAWGAIIVRYFS